MSDNSIPGGESDPTPVPPAPPASPESSAPPAAPAYPDAAAAGYPAPAPYPTAGHPASPAPVYPVAQPAPGQPAPGYPAQNYPAPGYAAPGHGAPAYVRPNSGLAITSLICGIAGLILGAFLIPLIASVVAVITGHMSLSQIKRDPSIGGKGLGITGLVLGYIGIAFLVGIIVTVVVSLVFLGTLGAVPFFFM